MKKSIFAVIAVALMVGFTNVHAMTEAELQAKLTKAYTINGVTYQADAAQKVQIERYLKENEISASEADFLASQVDEAVAVIAESGAKSISEIPAAYQEKLTAIANKVTDTTGIQFTVADGQVVVTDGSGKTILTAGDSMVKKTNNNNVIVASSLISLVGIAFVARKFF